MTKWHSMETLAGEKIVLSGHAQNRYKEYILEERPGSPVLSDEDVRMELWARTGMMEKLTLSPFERVHQARKHGFEAEFMTDGEFVFVFREVPDGLIMVTLYYLNGWVIR